MRDSADCVPCQAFSGQRIQFIEKQNRRSRVARRVKDVVHSSLALAHPHIEHVFDAHDDEARLTFTRRSSRNVSFAATRRAIEQNPAADFLAVGFVNFRVLKRINNIKANLLFEVIHAANAGKGHGRALDRQPHIAYGFDHVVLPTHKFRAIGQAPLLFGSGGNMAAPDRVRGASGPDSSLDGNGAALFPVDLEPATRAPFPDGPQRHRSRRARFTEASRRFSFFPRGATHGQVPEVSPHHADQSLVLLDIRPVPLQDVPTLLTTRLNADAVAHYQAYLHRCTQRIDSFLIHAQYSTLSAQKRHNHQVRAMPKTLSGMGFSKRV